MSNTRLFIGNLEYRATEDDLIKHFQSVGEVSDAIVCVDRKSGRARGFGFVEMATEKGARDAIKKLDETNLRGRFIRVKVALSED